MKIPRLVGLIGRKGAGKDTCAEVLMRRGYLNGKFAGALKDMVRVLLFYQGAAGEDIEQMVEGSLKEFPTDLLGGKSPRYVMQTLGTEWGRNLIGEDFWVQTAIRSAGKGPCVFTDVRFQNEKDALEEAGGVCFGVVADWIHPADGEHASEAEIDNLIAQLPSSRKIINYRAPPGREAEVIAEFQERFLSMISVQRV